MPSDDSTTSTHHEIRREPRPGEWRLGTPKFADRVDIALENGAVAEDGFFTADGWAASDGEKIPRSEVAGWRSRARTDATERPTPPVHDDIPVPIHDGAPMSRQDALHLRERMAHRQGFEAGWDAAVAALLKQACYLWGRGRDEEADILRRKVAHLQQLKGPEAVGEYHRELDGVDFDACRDMLLGQEGER